MEEKQFHGLLYDFRGMEEMFEGEFADKCRNKNSPYANRGAEQPCQECENFIS